MADATRVEAIEWCRQNKCDFKNPVYPPPSGWMWADDGKYLVLSPIFTSTDQGGDISMFDIESLDGKLLTASWDASTMGSGLVTIDTKLSSNVIGIATIKSTIKPSFYLGKDICISDDEFKYKDEVVTDYGKMYVLMERALTRLTYAPSKVNGNCADILTGEEDKLLTALIEHGPTHIEKLVDKNALADLMKRGFVVQVVKENSTNYFAATVLGQEYHVENSHE